MKNFNDELNNLINKAETDRISENKVPDFKVDEGFYDRARVPKRFRGVTFETHPNVTTEKVKAFCTKKGGGVLLLIGPVGTGKTETACCSFWERAKHGLPAGEYLNVGTEMCPMYRASRLSTSAMTEWQFFEHFHNLPFLVLDEAGHGDDPEIEKRVLLNLLESCYDNDTKIVITTNMAMPEFCKFVGTRVTDRLHQTAEICVLDGKSWRVK